MSREWISETVLLCFVSVKWRASCPVMDNLNEKTIWKHQPASFCAHLAFTHGRNDMAIRKQRFVVTWNLPETYVSADPNEQKLRVKTPPTINRRYLKGSETQTLCCKPEHFWKNSNDKIYRSARKQGNWQHWTKCNTARDSEMRKEKESVLSKASNPLTRYEWKIRPEHLDTIFWRTEKSQSI